MALVFRTLFLALVASATLGAGAALAGDAKPLIFQGEEQVAIRGYDPVAYFVAGEPVKGDAAFSAEHLDATWHFASAENRDLFVADPERYVPAYGGWCAYGMAMGGKVPIDPSAWKIVDGTLYLNVNQKVQGWWEDDIPGFIAKADNNWTTVQYE